MSGFISSRKRLKEKRGHSSENYFKVILNIDCILEGWNLTGYSMEMPRIL